MEILLFIVKVISLLLSMLYLPKTIVIIIRGGRGEGASMICPMMWSISTTIFITLQWLI